MSWIRLAGGFESTQFGLVNEVNDRKKHLPKRSGLLSVDGTAVNKDESPLSKDEEGEWLHKFTPAAF